MEFADVSSFNPFNSSLIQNSPVSLVAQTVKNLACNSGDWGLIPGSGRSPGEGKLPIPVFLPEEFHGQRRLDGL